MGPQVRHRLCVEAALAVATGLLAIVTSVWHGWIEAFGVDPDHGDGTAEWVVVAVLALVCVAAAVAARIEWRRLGTA